MMIVARCPRLRPGPGLPPHNKSMQRTALRATADARR
jgi:hypothetical protein